MSNNIFGSNDPWENGWANEQDTKPLHIPAYGATSGYLTSSQLLSKDEPVSGGGLKITQIPESYKKIHASVGSSLSTVSDLESQLFAKLIDEDYLSNYQKSKILDIMYDHNLLPASVENNLYQILGLIALEIDVPGSGDYVTLQFRLNSLPDLPAAVVSLIVEASPATERKDDFIDPLNAQLANTSLTTEDDEWKNPPNKLGDPILRDNTATTTLTTSVLASLDKDDSVKHTEQHPIDDNLITRHINEIRDGFKPLIGANDQIKIKEVPEKEGLLFKHINYIITHDIKLGMNGHAGTKKVIRRYSDFVWLLEFLLQKYPFRIIPGLPPKKFSGASPDSQFLQRRRRGLHRFLNQLIKHPILRQEPVVVTFLSVPTDISTWKKQAKIDYSLEFKGQKILTHFINSIWPTIGKEFLKNWATAENSITRLIEAWTKIVLLVERYEKRQQQISYDNGKFVEMLSVFKNANNSIYPADEDTILGRNNKDDINAINDSLGSIGEFFNKSSQVLIDESYSINTLILEKFKNYLDYLYSLQELFERTKRLSINTIDQLEKKIQDNEARYNKLSTEDAEVKGADLAKLRQVIINDKQEIFQQLNKDWLIKNCCFEEYLLFQETQFLISELWIDWSTGRLKCQEKLTTLQATLNGEVDNDMPLTR